MKQVFLYLDEVPLGSLAIDTVRGRETWMFRYDPEYLSPNRPMLDPSVGNVRGPQFPASGRMFGFLSDVAPDRWGRKLIRRREKRDLQESDFLLGVCDLTRAGALRLKLEKEGPFVASDLGDAAPLWTTLRRLEDAARHVDADEHGVEEERWVKDLFCPGSSLGGARPKANVVDTDGRLYVAKFPSKKDLEDTELIEYFSHHLAAAAGIQVAGTQVVAISHDRHLLLSERFDRTDDGRRVHFASAMSLLGLKDGAGSSTGNGYLDIVDFIIKGCVDARQNLRELYRRIAFNILFGNTDDHFRNHGFLLTAKGWTLSPAYDINPSTKSHQCLLIDPYTEQSDIHALLAACEYYMLEHQDAVEIVEEVRAAISDWRQVATQLHIPSRILAPYSKRWDEVKTNI